MNQKGKKVNLVQGGTNDLGNQASAKSMIVPIQTWQAGNDKLLKMTGDRKRYGGGPTRTTVNKGILKNKK